MSSTPAKSKNTFTSYVKCTEEDQDEKQNIIYTPKPRMLSGEVEVGSCYAQLYPPTSKITDNDYGIYGLLTVTNFKLSFLPSNPLDQHQITYQENLCLGRYDVTLDNIDAIYQIVDKKKKLITPQQKISSKIEALHVVCKNFRLLKFSFKYTAKDKGKMIANALATFAFPTREDVSFAYRYEEKYYNSLKSSVTMFNNKNDWTRELIRCGATEWRVLSSESIDCCNALKLPLYFVIPKCISNEKFIESSSAFYDSRTAFWVFSYGTASLLRMAELRANVTDTSIENVTLELIRKCDPQRKSLQIMNLSELLPSIIDVQRGYMKFRDLCTPDSPQQFLLTESKYYALLDKSCWLLYVSLCLKYSNEAAKYLRDGTTVVLRENNARDLCCVISSLVQVILDPYCRTINGFQSLIQKEWIALEHPFADRLGHVYKSHSTSSSSSSTSTEKMNSTRSNSMAASGTNIALTNFDSGFSGGGGGGGGVGDSGGGGGGTNNTVTEDITDHQQSPLLLLFLDCVWQLLQQFPSEFEFSQTYLTTLWDSAFIPIFDTFQFNTERERYHAAKELKLILRPVWDWSEQFAEKDKVFFTNPFYTKRPENYRKSAAIPANAILLPGFHHKPGLRFSMEPGALNHSHHQSTIPKDKYLTPKTRIYDLEIWQQCYHRWIPILEIKNGGFPQIDMFHRIILSNILKLQRAIETGDFDDLPENSKTTSSTFNEDITPTNTPLKRMPFIIDSFFPFSTYAGDSPQLNDILTSSNEILTEGSIIERLSIAQLPD